MTQAIDARQQFSTMAEKQPTEEYNFEHFRTIHLLEDARKTLEKFGVQPGEMAPDFELARADGGTLRLSDLRGRPVLIHFGSFT